jgi:hypothetical protein
MAEEARRRRVDDLKSLKIASFEKILEEVRAAARDKEEEERLLTERVLKDFVEFHQARKPQERHIAAPSFQTVLARKAEKSAKDHHQKKNMPPPGELEKRVKQMKGTDVVLVTEIEAVFARNGRSDQLLVGAGEGEQAGFSEREGEETAGRRGGGGGNRGGAD